MRTLLLGMGLWLVTMAPGAAQEPPFYEDKMDLMVYKDASGERHPVEDIEDWRIRRRHVLDNFQLVAGDIPIGAERTPPSYEVVENLAFGDHIRKKILIHVEEGDQLPAYLFIPADLDGPAPAMVCPHQTTPEGKAEVAGISGRENRQYAPELVKRGYVALAPDYPGFGDYKDIDVYAMGYVSATAKGIFNHMRCVDLLQSLDEVDPERIGAMGHSLGGHNTLFLGLFDKRVKAMITSCGFNRFAKYYGGDLTGWSHKGYMPRIAEEYGADASRMPFDFTEILGALAPRPVFINAPLHDDNFEVSGVRDCLEAARPVYALYGAEDNLQAVFPDCGHDFPPETREKAYEFLGKALKHGG